jgi:hypothetical protein
MMKRIRKIMRKGMIRWIRKRVMRMMRRKRGRKRRKTMM